jgi:hypothetical protein
MLSRAGAKHGRFDLVLDCVSSADARDGAAYHERIRAMEPPIVKRRARIAPHRTAPHRIASHRIASHRTGQHSTAQHSTAPHSTE